MPYYDEGYYTVRVTSQQLAHTEKGTACLVFAILPLTRHTGGGDEPVSGDPRSVAFYFSTDENARISIEQLRALGWHGTSFSQLAGDGEAGWSLVGEEIPAFCRYETWTKDGQEKQSEKWSFKTGTGGMKVKAADAGHARQLDAKFGHILKTVKPQAAPPARNGTRPAPAGVTTSQPDDEIPF